MPTSSIENDHVDMILPPEEIAIQLAILGKRFGDTQWLKIENGKQTLQEARDFARILKLLKGVSGVDFRLYKPSSIRRRVARRMVIHKMDTLTEYVMLLQITPAELRALQGDILINVTRFFRDPEVFEMLKSNVIPHLLADREPDQQIRMWVAGCSTGEEVYSIAICLLEQLGGTVVEPSIQIFGTDASEENVHRARMGIYAESISNEVSPERPPALLLEDRKGLPDQQASARPVHLCSPEPVY